MSNEAKNFMQRFLQHPLPVIFAAFYMYWMSKMLNWAMTLSEPDKAEWLVAAVVAGAVGYFKFYVDLVVKTDTTQGE